MKPFTIRKQAQPSRAGAAAGDASMDMSMKYATGPAGMSGSGLMPSPDEYATQGQQDETLLDQNDLDKLAEEFPGKVPENPWIKEQTNKQYLTAIKVSTALTAFLTTDCAPSLPEVGYLPIQILSFEMRLNRG